MARLKIKGLTTIDPDSNRPYANELEDGRKVSQVLKWWDRKQAQYINVLRIHVSRTAGDIDLLIPADGAIELDLNFDDTGLIDFRHHKYVSRVGIADHHTNKVLAEYIFPKLPGQKVRLKQYSGLYPSSSPAGVRAFSIFYTEDHPNLDLGDYSTTHGFWDVELGTTTLDLNGHG